MATTSTVKLLTTGILAKKLGQPVHRVSYILATRGHIRPAALAGNARLYDLKALAMLRHELNAIDARRVGAPCVTRVLNYPS